MLYLLFLIWPAVSIIFFLFIDKRWGKKNHIALSIFYAITFLIPFPLEKLVEISIRNKYARLTPKVFELLNKAGVKYHAVYGTFLFFYRNGNFKDNDIDLAVWEKDWNDKTEEAVKSAGFIKEEEFYLNGELKENCYKHNKLNVSMDIFIIDDKKPKAYGFDEERNRYATKPYDYKYAIKTYKYKGVEFNAPSEPGEYLTWIYGPWKDKDPNYHWFTGSSKRPNVVVEDVVVECKKIS